MSVEDFTFIKEVGSGAFGSVFLASEKATGNYFAIKQLEKRHIVKNDKTDSVMREKALLLKLKTNPLII